MLFFALPNCHFSTLLIFVASRLLHFSCSLAFSSFQFTTCCSIVLRSPLSTTRILRIDSCFLLLISLTFPRVARCSVLSTCSARCSPCKLLTGYILLPPNSLFACINSMRFPGNRQWPPTARLGCTLICLSSNTAREFVVVVRCLPLPSRYLDQNLVEQKLKSFLSLLGPVVAKSQKL